MGREPGEQLWDGKPRFLCYISSSTTSCCPSSPPHTHTHPPPHLHGVGIDVLDLDGQHVTPLGKAFHRLKVAEAAHHLLRYRGGGASGGGVQDAQRHAHLGLQWRWRRRRRQRQRFIEGQKPEFSLRYSTTALHAVYK